MNWIEMLQPIIDEYKDGNPDEALDGDEVDDLCGIIHAKINLQEGNITNAEYERILDGLHPFRISVLDGREERHKEDPADRDDRLYHEGVDIEAMDRAIHNNPLGVGFAQKDRKENK